MGFQETNFWKWWKVYGIHIEALLILIAFLGIIYVYVDNSQLQEEIKTTCGWELDEDMYCSCKKDLAQAWKQEAEAQMNPFLNIPNFTKNGIRE